MKKKHRVGEMRKEDMAKCMHKIFGYPPSSKRHWELKRLDPSSYSCICSEGKRVIKDVSILVEEERVCRFCGRRLVPHFERVYYVVCSWCGEMRNRI